MQENESITLPDGRTLSYAIYGSPAPQTTVFYFHGFPSSRLEGRLWHSAVAKLSIRLIAPDRPGHGNSTFQPNRALLDWPKDVLALADHLKIEHFYIIGTSGGAPYALACVKGIPRDRLAGAAVVSGLYPAAFGTAGMLLKTRILLWVSPWATGLVGTLMDMAVGKAARDPDPQKFADLMEQEIAGRHEGDVKAMMDPEHWDDFVAMSREAVRLGSEGAAWEARLIGSPWGFELGELEVGEGGVPLSLWHGTEDANCPTAMAMKAKEIMPKASLHLKEGEAHVSYIWRDADEILKDLVGGSA